MGTLTNYNDNGFIGVANNASSPVAGMYVNVSAQGVIYGNTKSFRMDHPRNPSQEIWYTSIEGPEAAAYVRGTARLVNGTAVVPFPEYFSLVVNPDTLTTILTPRSAQSKGLAVVAQDGEGIRVQELGEGTGDYEFDWEVKGVRQGYEDFQPVRLKDSISSFSKSKTSENTAPLSSGINK